MPNLQAIVQCLAALSAKARDLGELVSHLRDAERAGQAVVDRASQAAALASLGPAVAGLEAVADLLGNATDPTSLT
jgi:hypothetical protein